MNRVFGVLIALGVLMMLARGAAYRQLMFDEAFDIRPVSTCVETYGSMIIDGAKNQCNRAPLFSMIQKVAISLPPTLDRNVYLFFRLPVILLAASIFLVLFFGFAKTVGFWPVFAASAAVMAQQMLMGHGTEARPYVPWLALSFSFYFQVYRFMLLDVNVRPRLSHLILLAANAIALVMMVGPSLVQVFFGLVAIFVVRLLDKPDPHQWKSVFLDFMKYFGFVGIASLAVFLYYVLPFGCSDVSIDEGSNLIQTLARGDFSLIKGVLRVVATKGIPHLLMLFVMVFGLAILAIRFYKKEAVDKINRALLILATTIGVAAVVIGIAVVQKNYFFNNRTFIFLICLQSVLIMLGLRLLLNHLSKVQKKVLPALYAALVLHMLFSASELWQRNQTEFAWASLPVSEEEKEKFCSKLAFRNILIENHKLDDDGGQLYSGFLVRFDDFAKKHCDASKINREVSYFLAISTNSPTDWYRHSDEHPGRFHRQIKLCKRHLEVSFSKIQ